MSWTDTQIQATVGLGSAAGSAQVINHTGQISNTIPFVVGVPQISTVTPSTGIGGAQVTVTGMGFGSSQGNATLVLGTKSAVIASWSDTQITATVAAGSLSGVAQVIQGAAPSNGVPFTITTPQITLVSPQTALSGSTVTISGSGFGQLQGSGVVWLGGALATVGTWTDQSVTAVVSTGARTGSVQVQQGGVLSNSLPFSVSMPTITAINPPGGAPGTRITISGSGFGSSQGTGNVWLGTAYGNVYTWSDLQVVADVAAGSNSGTVQILQNGVWSNSVAFATAPSPQVTSVTPASAAPGASVTIAGSRFGASQGTGVVWLGTTYGLVSAGSWSDQQIVATVASNSQNGTVSVKQNGVKSNTLPFSVTTSGTPGPALQPAIVAMLVGGTRTLQALDSSGNVQHGLSWTASDNTIVSLSTDDPPIITALLPGQVIITAGQASSTITVYAGPYMPVGTVNWAIPGDGSGVSNILPAVPSSTGVADVFAVQASGLVQAVQSDGTVAWSANAGYDATGNPNKLLPDFHGGLVAVGPNSLQRLDGLTGQPTASYTFANPPSTPLATHSTSVVHTDGTIFTLDGDSVVGLDPATGAQKFSVPLDHSTFDFTQVDTGTYCNSSPRRLGTRRQAGSTTHTENPPTVGNLMIAGDGYAYAAYYYSNSTSVNYYSNCFSGTGHVDAHLRVLRVGSAGDSSKIVVSDWSEDFANFANPFPQPSGGFSTQAGVVPGITLSDMITNADQGAVLSWEADFGAYCASSVDGTKSGCVAEDKQFKLTTLAGSSATTTPLNVPGQDQALAPMLQAQDGTYVGTVDSQGQSLMAGFDLTGNMKWMVPGFTPQIATSDGGVIAQSADGSSTVTFDANGNATGLMASLSPGGMSGTGLIPSWNTNFLGAAYSSASGSSEAIAASPIGYAATFAATLQGNHSGQGTAIQQVTTNKAQGSVKQLPDLNAASCRPPHATPTCGNINAIEVLTTQSPDAIFKKYIQTFTPLAAGNNPVMAFNPGENINVTGPGQTLTIYVQGPVGFLAGAFGVLTERVDPVNHVISVVTLQGHPLAGWRYWRVYSIGTNDVVIETGAYDQPGPGLINYLGYFIASGTGGAVSRGWQKYLQFIQADLHAQQGTNLHNSLGGIDLKKYLQRDPDIFAGYMDYDGDFTNYILNNVCQSTACN